jgi:hypothetical protein
LETQKSQTAKAILNRKSSAVGITTVDFKLYCTAIAIKIAWYWHKKDQWKRIEDPDMSSHSYAHLILD